MNDGGRYSIQSPILSNLPPARSTLSPPFTFSSAFYTLAHNPTSSGTCSHPHAVAHPRLGEDALRHVGDALLQ